MGSISTEEQIHKLYSKVASCKKCDLHKTRTNTVPGAGNISAKIMFIGEAPGKNEDLKGKPFCGRAGDIFDKLLDSINFTRDNIYVANILKCRPPGNRNPQSSEIAACVSSLDQQIKIINPTVIATMGNFSTAYIFQKFSIPPATITSVAGKPITKETEFGEKIIVPLFHPAVATYNPSKIEVLLNDFKVLKKIAENTVKQEVAA